MMLESDRNCGEKNRATWKWEKLVRTGITEKVALKKTQISEGTGSRQNPKPGKMPRELSEMPYFKHMTSSGASLMVVSNC